MSPTTLPGGAAAVVSPNGAYRTYMQGDGNLVVYASTGARWASGTRTPGAWLAVQPDGNVVVYDPWGYPIWGSATSGPGVALAMQNDGNLVAYDTSGRAMWDSSDFTHHASVKLVERRAVSSLKAGSSATSPNGAFLLAMQGDGNLVVYNRSAGAPVWWSGTSGAAAHLEAQADGNVVIYSGSGRVLWQLGIHSPGDHLFLRDDGGLQVADSGRRVLWNSR